MLKPLVSCVMPTRNREKEIGEAIKSIVEQTFKDWELIIVDDHSDEEDATKSVIENFKDKRIKYYKLDDIHGKGVACARNFGNIKASGKYIAVMDSDDISYKTRFEEQVRILEKGEYDVVYSEIDYWWPEKNVCKKRDNDWYGRDFTIKEYLKVNFVAHVTAIYSKRMALSYPYNSFFRKAEDYDLFLRFAKHDYKFKFIDKSLVKVRKHEGSITKENLDEFRFDKLAVENFNIE